MTIEVHRYTDDHAAGLAELLNRTAYGPAAHGVAIDAGQLRRVFIERGITDCMIGVEGDDICGCIAFSIGSGRRAAAAHERFAGLFVIDERHRNSMLAGKLFRELFATCMVKRGVRTLRIEANPANVRAFPLYLRVGFRARPDARPDQDGFIELVSHLPGVIDDLVLNNGEADMESVAHKINWRMMRGGRNLDPAEGVVREDNRLTIHYPINTGDFELTAVVDYETGSLLRIEQTRGRVLTAPKAEVVVVESAQTLLRAPLANNHELLVLSDGTFELARCSGAANVLLLRERWPVALGHDAPAVRRQGERRKIRATKRIGGWMLQADQDPITRMLEVRDDGATVELRSRSVEGTEVVTSPWITMRIAEHALRNNIDGESQWHGGPVLPGLWPADWVDFEAAHDALEASASWWSDGISSLEISWSGQARSDARCAPAVQAAAPGEEVVVTIRLAADSPSIMHPVPGLHPVSTPTRRRSRSQMVAVATPTDSLAEFTTAAKQSGMRELHAGVQRLKLADEVGLIDWQVQGTSAVVGSFPAGAPFASLGVRRVGLWCTGLIDRHDADQGVEWADDRGALPYAASVVENSWGLRMLGDAGLRVRAHAQAPETAIHFVPNTSSGLDVLVLVLGRVWHIDAGDSWHGAVAAAAVTLRDGRVLLAQPVGDQTELFLRAASVGLLITALGHGELQLDLRVVESRVIAERLMTQVSRA